MKSVLNLNYFKQTNKFSLEDLQLMKDFFKNEYMHMDEQYLKAMVNHFIGSTYDTSHHDDKFLDYKCDIKDAFTDEVKKLYANDYLYYSVYATDLYMNKYVVRVPYQFNGSIIDAFLDLDQFDHPTKLYNYGLTSIKELYETRYVNYFDNINNLYDYMDKNHYNSVEELLLEGILYIRN